VATWYGGVLGVGEYSYRFGISNWLVFGVPYYLAALAFAFVLAGRVRASAVLSIPEQLAAAYGRPAARLGAALVLLMCVPAAYVLMLGDLVRIYLGLDLVPAVVVSTAFTAGYVAVGGFRGVVRANELQFALMFAAFLVVLPTALARTGGVGGLWSALPPASRSWDGGLGTQAVLVWYVIAMQTLVEPTFYQRCYAARSPAIARRGVLVSIGFWLVFDFLTTFTGLAARVLLPDLDDPVLAYPRLGALVLPPLANALFAVGLFATVMSTSHSYLFLAAATVGHDILPVSAGSERRRTAVGLAVAALAAVALALTLRSVVAIWHDVGSVVTASLLLPLSLSHFGRRAAFRPGSAMVAIASSAAVALAWIASREVSGSYPLGVEPVFPALGVSAACWLAGRAGKGGEGRGVARQRRSS
ncbi:MAG: sodium:solute symporter family protein, partial [Acidobacteriota bacterium]